MFYIRNRVGKERVKGTPPYIVLNLKWQAAERSVSILGVRADEP